MKVKHTALLASSSLPTSFTETSTFKFLTLSSSFLLKKENLFLPIESRAYSIISLNFSVYFLHFPLLVCSSNFILLVLLLDAAEQAWNFSGFQKESKDGFPIITKMYMTFSFINTSRFKQTASVFEQSINLEIIEKSNVNVSTL